MDQAAVMDPVLARFRATLGEMYGDRLKRVVLFGSRARGDGRPDSDYDIAVFLESLADRWSELDRLANLRLQFLLDGDAFFDAKPFAAEAYHDPSSPLMHEIRREGIEV